MTWEPLNNFQWKGSYGSGTPINSRFVLTAAHNLYPKYFEKEPDSILFIPECPYGIIGVRRYFYPRNIRMKDMKTTNYQNLKKIRRNYRIYRDWKHIAEGIDNIECSLYGYLGYVYNQAKKNDYLNGMNGRVSLNDERNLLIYKIDSEGDEWFESLL